MATIRPKDYPPLVAWYGHIEACSTCARGILDYDFSRQGLCEDGYEIRCKAREKTRWATNHGVPKDEF